MGEWGGGEGGRRKNQNGGVLRDSLPRERVCERDEKNQNFAGRQNESFEISLSVLAKESSAKIKRHRFMF